jgi:hypothetical protein
MGKHSTTKVHSWEYKLPLVPTKVAGLGPDRVTAFLDDVLSPGLIPGVSSTPTAGEPGTSTVEFYDTIDFDYYEYLPKNAGGFILRWRTSPKRTDLTLKLRSTDESDVQGQNPSSSLSTCDDIAFKEELGGDATPPGYVKQTWALDNELKSTKSNCDFPSVPTDEAGWAQLFPILQEVGNSGQDVMRVNGLVVRQTQLAVVNLTFDGNDAEIEGDLLVWENTNQPAYAQYLAAEFSFSINYGQLGSDRPPDICEQFLSSLWENADPSWLGAGMKTHSVYYPASA